MTSVVAHVAKEVFDGDRLRADIAVLVEGGRIAAIAPRSQLSEDLERIDHGDALIAPGFVDLQVNGGGGYMLNDGPSAEGIALMAAAHRRFGTTSMLPTLITDTPEAVDAAISAVEEARRSLPGIAGLHLEGPHLWPGRRGAHVADLMRPMTDQDAEALVDARRRVGSLLVTVAAEQVEPRLIRRLTDSGVVVSIGHSDADYDSAMRAFDAGARLVTHLFNAMSPLGHRAPGLVGAALDAGNVHAGIIADGYHVHPAAIGAAVRAKRSPGGIFLVTDAMSTVGSSDDGFVLNGRRIKRVGDRLTLDDGTLAGSTIDMAASVRLLVERVGLSREAALAMATSGPAGAMGLGDGRGALKAGGRADLAVLSGSLDVTRTYVGGREN